MRDDLIALIAKWRENADMLAEGNKNEIADPAVGMQRACADQLEAALTAQRETTQQEHAHHVADAWRAGALDAGHGQPLDDQRRAMTIPAPYVAAYEQGYAFIHHSDVATEMSRRIDTLAQRLTAQGETAKRNRFDCPTCGKGVAVDEDGCCRSCGADATPVVNGAVVYRPEQDPAAQGETAPDDEAAFVAWLQRYGRELDRALTTDEHRAAESAFLAAEGETAPAPGDEPIQHWPFGTPGSTVAQVFPAASPLPAAERLAEHIERLEAMVEDNGQTWDLSDNDTATLRVALTALRAVAEGRR